MTRPIDPPRDGGAPDFETRVQTLAASFAYPPTPGIAGDVRARLARRPAAAGRLRLAQAALIALVLIALLMAVPSVRAGVVNFFRIGAVKIFLVAPTPTSTPKPAAQVEPGFQFPLTATPAPGPTAIPTFSLADLDGETTLAAARKNAGFPVLLPAYPSNLGPPDRVYLQHYYANIVIMVWLDSVHPGQVRMSLHALGPGSFAMKMVPLVLAELQINGQRAVWTQGPYELIYKGGGVEQRQMVSGHALLWTVGDVTYRLETTVTLDEAVKTAESLK